MKQWIPLAISKKICYFPSKAKKIIVFAFTYVLENLALIYGDLWIYLFSVCSDEARPGSVKRFIASIFRSR